MDNTDTEAEQYVLRTVLTASAHKRVQTIVNLCELVRIYSRTCANLPANLRELAQTSRELAYISPKTSRELPANLRELPRELARTSCELPANLCISYRELTVNLRLFHGYLLISLLNSRHIRA